VTKTSDKSYALTLAGHDPSGGAGLSADLKVFNTLGVLGLSVCTALTYQTEDHFDGLDWVPLEQLMRQAERLLTQYPIGVVKVGLIESWAVLESILTWMRQLRPELIIVWDPVLSASAGFDFHAAEADRVPETLAQLVDIITPNWEEMQQLMPSLAPQAGAAAWAQHSAVLLKGGHRTDQPGVDTLYADGQVFDLPPLGGRGTLYDKHGTGCVLSAAIAGWVARNPDVGWQKACIRAKEQVERYMASDEGLLGLVVSY